MRSATLLLLALIGGACHGIGAADEPQIELTSASVTPTVVYVDSQFTASATASYVNCSNPVVSVGYDGQGGAIGASTGQWFLTADSGQTLVRFDATCFDQFGPTYAAGANVTIQVLPHP
jgi:hypothetical protein